MPKRGEEGYTLLEVLVAFVILAGAVIMSFRIFGDGLHRLNAADQQVQMMTVAQELMAGLQIATRLTPGTTSGRSQDFAWTITLTPSQPTDDAPQKMALFQARIDIRASDADRALSYRLETHLLAFVQ